MINEDWFAEAKERRHVFLEREIGKGFSVQPMTSDMAPRYYHRITTEDKTFVLLESAPDGHSQALPGHEIGAFVKINRFLNTEGFRVPDIYAAQEEQGLLLLEDFGDLSFEKALESADQQEAGHYYFEATELLSSLRQIGTNRLFELPVFLGSRIDMGVRRFADWFLPYYFDRSVSDEEIEGFEQMLLEMKSALPETKQGFVHGDFHPANLMILEDGEFGLLDFQAAMRGPCVYDLTNLLHDARRKVPNDIIQTCQEAYFLNEENNLSNWYNYLSLHFHLRVIGQFIKIAITTEKTHYLGHLDRLARYLSQNESLVFREYSEQLGIKWEAALPNLDLQKVAKYIRPDAT